MSSRKGSYLVAAGCTNGRLLSRNVLFTVREEGKTELGSLPSSQSIVTRLKMHHRQQQQQLFGFANKDATRTLVNRPTRPPSWKSQTESPGNYAALSSVVGNLQQR